MQRLLAIAALAACALAAAAEDDAAAASAPAYVTLGPADIVNGALVDSPESWIVALADPQASGDSDRKLDIVKEAAATLGGYGVRTAVVDCTDDGHASAATRKCLKALGVKSVKNLPPDAYPVVMGFTAPAQHNPYASGPAKMQRLPTAQFQGALSERALLKWIVKALPSQVERVVAPAQWAAAVDAAAAAGAGACLMFTEKTSTPPLYKAISAHFAGRLLTLEAHAESAELAAEVGADDFPSLYAVGAAGAALTRFEGELKWGPITAFLEAYAGEAKAAEAPPRAAEAHPEPEGGGGGPRGGKRAAREATPLDAAGAAGVLADDAAWVVLHRVGGAPAEDDPLHAAWRAASGKADGLLKAGVVDCGADGAAPCAAHKKESYLRVYAYGKSAKQGDADLYGLGEADAAFEVAGESLPDLVEVLPAGIGADVAPGAEGDAPPLGLIDEGMIRASQQGKLMLLVLSKRDRASPLLRSVAKMFEGLVQINLVPSPGPVIMNRFQVRKMPALLLVYSTQPPAGSEAETEGRPSFAMAPYDTMQFGPVGFSSLSNFLMEVLRGVVPRKAAELADVFEGLRADEKEGGVPEAASSVPDFEAALGGAAETAARQASNAVEHVGGAHEAPWADACPSTAPLCAVMLARGAHGSGADGSAHRNDLAALDDVRDRVNKLGEPGKLVKYAALDGACEAGFAAAFGVTADMLPMLVAYAPKVDMAARYVGSFEPRAMARWVQQLVGGGRGQSQLAPLPAGGLPALANADCAALAGGDAVEEDDFDMSDMLAEIQADEEAARVAAAEKAKAEATAEKEAKEAAKAEAKAEEEAAEKKKKAKKKKAKKKKKAAKAGL